MLTLAICTYNRCDLLSGALASLRNCDQPKGEWELLIVDNGSNDNTQEVISQYKAQLPINEVYEVGQGLSYARNRALRECKGDVILFTDDDLVFEKEWLVTYESAFEEMPDCLWFGGRVKPLWNEGRPAWLRDENMSLISGLLVNYDLGDVNRAYKQDDPEPFGASFALRRQLFERIGLFRVDLGVSGGTPGRGEEAEYLNRAKEAGNKGFYVGEAFANHRQDAARFSWRYLYVYGLQKGIAQRKLDEDGKRQVLLASFYHQLVYTAKAIMQLIKGRGDRARQCVINIGIQRGLSQ